MWATARKHLTPTEPEFRVGPDRTVPHREPGTEGSAGGAVSGDPRPTADAARLKKQLPDGFLR